jgi:intracellular septation protein A
MNTLDKSYKKTAANNSHPLIDALISVLIPSFILMKFSDPESLGPVAALLIALSLPLGWGLMELIRYRKFNFIALLGLISVFLTGGIGLLQLDVEWLAVKEAAIPAIIGLAVLVSTYTPYPLIKTLLFNEKIMQVEKINQTLAKRGTQAEFEYRLLWSTYYLSGTFFFSAVMNYVLAKWIVISPAGSSAFNEELGRLTLLSYPMIAIPSMLMMMGILYYLWRTIERMTGLSIQQVLVAQSDQQSSK